MPKQQSVRVQITELEPPSVPVETVRWGTVAYQEWCRREAIRICEAGRMARVEPNEAKTRCAVFVLEEERHGLVHV